MSTVGTDITLRTEGLSKRLGAFLANSDVSLTDERLVVVQA